MIVMTDYKAGQEIWVVKSALAKGIQKLRLHEVDAQAGWAWVEAYGAAYAHYLKADRDFFASKEAAIERANALRSKQIAALERRIKKLKELEF
jgi:hypothetical protein